MSGQIYFMVSKDGNVLKIGHTTGLTRRLARHAKDHCREFELLGACPGEYSDEQRTHAVLRRHRIVKEWYWFCPTVSAFVDLALEEGIRIAMDRFHSEKINHCKLSRGHGR